MSDVFRQEYTPVTEESRAKVLALKVKAQELWDLMAPIVTSETNADGTTSGSKIDTREMALARTNLEQAVMWAVKSLTSEEFNPKS